jgi:hypothetical protein
MKIKNNYLGYFALSALFTAFFSFGSCNKAEDAKDPSTSGNAQVSVHLTDGPANYEAIFLDVQQVEILSDAGISTMLTPSRQGLYNLLDLKNGVDVLLTTGPVPAGTVSQIRLLLGPNNSLVENGVTYPLKTPSAQESGLKLQLKETLVPGGAYAFWLDFDASKSIVQTGNGKYLLKPVIRAYTALTNGRIAGYVVPFASLTTVYAINGVDTFGAIPGANGYYQIGGLPAGNYQVYFDAGAPGFTDALVPNVQVNYGAVTDLGTYTIIP